MPPKRIAIIGTRDYPTFRGEHPVTALIRTLPAGTTVVTSAEWGVYRLAESIARMSGFAVTLIETEGESQASLDACDAVTRQIVRMADEVYAYWDGRSRGTAFGIRLAIEFGKPVAVVDVAGRPLAADEIKAALARLDSLPGREKAAASLAALPGFRMPESKLAELVAAGADVSLFAGGAL